MLSYDYGGMCNLLTVNNVKQSFFNNFRKIDFAEDHIPRAINYNPRLAYRQKVLCRALSIPKQQNIPFKQVVTEATCSRIHTQSNIRRNSKKPIIAQPLTGILKPADQNELNKTVNIPMHTDNPKLEDKN